MFAPRAVSACQTRIAESPESVVGNFLFDPEFQEAAAESQPLEVYVPAAIRRPRAHRPGPCRLLEHAARFVDIDLFN